MMEIGSLSHIFWGVLAIGLGSLFLFFGVRIFRTAVGLVGFAAFSVGAYVLIGQVYRSFVLPSSNKTDFARYGLSILAGILGGFVSVWLWKVALVSLGVLGGLGLALYTMSWKSNGLISNTTWRTVFITVLAAVGGITAIFLETPIIVLTTSVIGALSLSSGIDAFLDTGFNKALEQLIQNRGGKFSVGASSYGLLGSCGIAALVGMACQLYMVRKSKQKSLK